ncbi:hypothetical protein BC1002_2359 [Paraburkholderia atlantica]|uniref:Uncharacterized protein n=1 Tax=Paraburkholderia atlantica TaxID=2654982 RepID=D5WBN6_PARAM|nr:hypothetical protein BC1002_2359 [Paraburkholderia atlantica]
MGPMRCKRCGTWLECSATFGIRKAPIACRLVRLLRSYSALAHQSFARRPQIARSEQRVQLLRVLHLPLCAEMNMATADRQ